MDVTTISGQMGEFYLHVVPNYVDIWITHFPDTVKDINAPIPIPPLSEYLDYGEEIAIA